MVSNLETSGLLQARFFSEFIPELDVARESAFERAGEVLAGSHLLFFDPDVGVEVKSTAYGARGSSRYVYWRELEAAWENGTSLLIYQHFPRQEHATFAARIAEEVRSHAPTATVFTLASQDVVYLLAVQPSHKSQRRLRPQAARGPLRPLLHHHRVRAGGARAPARCTSATHAAEVPHRRLLERAGRRLDCQRAGPGELRRPRHDAGGCHPRGDAGASALVRDIAGRGRLRAGTKLPQHRFESLVPRDRLPA